MPASWFSKSNSLGCLDELLISTNSSFVILMSVSLMNCVVGAGTCDRRASSKISSFVESASEAASSLSLRVVLLSAVRKFGENVLSCVGGFCVLFVDGCR